MMANAEDDRCGAPPSVVRRSRAQRRRARLRCRLFRTGAAAGLPPCLVEMQIVPKNFHHEKSGKAMLARDSECDGAEPQIHDVPNGILYSSCAAKTSQVNCEKYDGNPCLERYETTHGKSDTDMLVSAPDGLIGTNVCDKDGTTHDTDMLVSVPGGRTEANVYGFCKDDNANGITRSSFAAPTPQGVNEMQIVPKNSHHEKMDNVMLRMDSDGDGTEPQISDVPHGIVCSSCPAKKSQSMSERCDGHRCLACYGMIEPNTYDIGGMDGESSSDPFCFKCYEMMHRRGKSDKAFGTKTYDAYDKDGTTNDTDMMMSVPDGRLEANTCGFCNKDDTANCIFRSRVYEKQIEPKNSHHEKVDNVMLRMDSDGDGIETQISDVPHGIVRSRCPAKKSQVMSEKYDGHLCLACYGTIESNTCDICSMGGEKYSGPFCLKCCEMMHRRGKLGKAKLTSDRESGDTTKPDRIDTYAGEEFDEEAEDDSIPIDIYDAFARACSDAIVDLTLQNSEERVTAALERTMSETASHFFGDSAEGLWTINRMARRHIQLLDDLRISEDHWLPTCWQERAEQRA
ncbi:unnamed protein product [Prorocentrum cordatum]|uniref:Zinc finger PHD-type domain-containing protein n=1 Tax=Prorocentrum cordatum TaxID=2364126 RepID=A0ABN9QVA1_9DINO|nr:unnamed protein product [Polarella glacialis]